MPQSFRTTSLSVDSGVVARLMDVAQETDIYDTRAEAQADNWEAVLSLLMGRFEATPGPLRADVGTKYSAASGRSHDGAGQSGDSPDADTGGN